MLTTGITGQENDLVTPEKTAAHAGSGLLAVYATPMMIALMEETCHKSVAPYLEAGESTVGISVNITHVAATPPGQKITCKSELTAIDRRKLTFKVSAYDEKGLIGEGEHERFIINNERFLAKVMASHSGN